jgi:hypothetical protein
MTIQTLLPCLQMFVKVFKTADSKLIIYMNKYSHSTDEADKIDIMFRFIQYIERQIVLFDAKMPLSYCK